MTWQQNFSFFPERSNQNHSPRQPCSMRLIPDSRSPRRRSVLQLAKYISRCWQCLYIQLRQNAEAGFASFLITSGLSTPVEKWCRVDVTRRHKKTTKSRQKPDYAPNGSLYNVVIKASDSRGPELARDKSELTKIEYTQIAWIDSSLGNLCAVFSARLRFC